MSEQSPDITYQIAELPPDDSGFVADLDFTSNHVLSPYNAWRIVRSRTGLGCSRSTFYRWVSSGRIRAVRFGARIYIPWREIERVVHRCLGPDDC